QSIFDLLGEEAAKTFKHQYPEIKKGKGLSFEATLISKTKEKVPVLINQTSLFDKEGNFNGSLCLVVDMTELKRTQEKLRKAERLSTIAQVAQEAAHEIKNPLAVLGVGLYYLRKMLPEDEKIKKKINQMDRAVERASSYLSDLSSLSRPPIIELSPIDINDLIEQVSGDISLDLLTGIELRKDLAKDLPKIQVDPDRLRQVFTNLIKNACEVMPEGGALTISSCIDGSQIVITFSDTGPGIKEENLEKLFDPFFTTKSKGTGLGLAICKRIIEAHQGTIEIESKVGKGTRFIIRLPVD
ncbi:PAS domain-containing protein, partial [bacterium]|nr:PAS domain-containing protein [bacterium]MBU1614857.1 PAS domain-containing protein [bacterium]